MPPLNAQMPPSNTQVPPLNAQVPQDPLAQLKDIHLPDAISAWPPAPGWWILAAIVLSLFIWGCLSLLKRKKQNRYRQQALHELAQLSNQESPLTEINALLKRIALVAYPEQQVASLNGNQWVRFLHRSCPQLSDDTFMLLARGPYQDPAQISDSDIESLKSHCVTWIKKHAATLSQEPSQQTKPDAEAV